MINRPSSTDTELQKHFLEISLYLWERNAGYLVHKTNILLSFKLINSFNTFKQPLWDYTHSNPGLYGRFQ